MKRACWLQTLEIAPVGNRPEGGHSTGRSYMRSALYEILKLGNKRYFATVLSVEVIITQNCFSQISLKKKNQNKTGRRKPWVNLLDH